MLLLFCALSHIFANPSFVLSACVVAALPSVSAIVLNINHNIGRRRNASLAEWTRCRTSNPKIAGLSPAGDVFVQIPLSIDGAIMLP